MRRLLVLVFVALAVPGRAVTTGRVESAIFFYPWYSNAAHDGGFAHWQQGAHTPPSDIGSAYFPLRGPYSSGDPRVLDTQMREISRAGVGEVISSWWGWGSPEDERLTIVRRTAARYGLAVAVQLEPYAGRSIESVGRDLQHLREIGIRDVYVYRAEDFSADGWAGLRLRRSGVRTFAQTDLVGFAARAGFDGFYTYDIVVYGGDKFERLCSEAHKAGLLCAPSVGPGYDAQEATGDPNMKPRADGATYNTMWRAALSADADLVTITSYNEWGEGTQIEPAGRGGRYDSYDGAYGLHGRKASYAYLRATRRWTERFRKR